MLNIPQEVQDLFLSGTVHKNLRVHFPNGERADITNDQIVKESLKFNESLCSRDALKFGMSEASTIEFETVGVENILGMTIEVGIEVDLANDPMTQYIVWEYYPDCVHVSAEDSDIGFEYCRVPLGIFVVTACPRSHGAMTHRRVIGYSSAHLTAGVLSDFDNYKINQCMYYVDKYEVTTELIYSTLFAHLPDSGVQSIFTRTEVGGNGATSNFWGADEIGQFDIRGVSGPYPRIMSSTNPWDRPDRYSAAIHGNIWRYIVASNDEEWSAGNVLMQAHVQGLNTLRAILRESIGARLDSLGVDLSTAYYLDQYGREVHFETHAAGVSYLADRMTPRVLVYSSVTNNTLAMNYTPFSREVFSDEYSEIFSSVPWNVNPYEFHIEAPSYVDGWRMSFFTADGYMRLHQEEVTISAYTPEVHFYMLTPKAEVRLEEGLTAELTSTGEGVYNGYTTYSFSGALNFMELFSGMLEVQGKFGKILRAGGVAPFYLYAQKTGSQLNTKTRSMRQGIALSSVDELWWDEYNISPIGVVLYTYQDAETQKEYTYVLNIGSGLSTYRIKNNEFLRLYGEVTAASLEVLFETYFTFRVRDMGDFTPCEMTMQGMPWVEAGDYLAIDTGAEDVPKVYTYMLQRTLTGIQHLEDKVVSVSGEITGE